MLNSSKIILIFLLLSTLLACSTTPIKSPEEMIEDHGLITGTINSAEVFGITLRSASSKTIFIGTTGDHPYSRTISHWLPSGTYELDSIAIVGAGKHSTIDIPKGALSKITITNGNIVDINHLIPVNIGGGKYITLSIPRDSSFKPQIQHQNPNIFSDSKIYNWVDNGKPAISQTSLKSTEQGLIADLILAYGERIQQGEINKKLSKSKSHQAALSIVKQLSLPTTELTIDDDSEGYFGTILGQVRFKKNTEWSSIDTGRLEAITQLALIDKSIFAGFESGVVLISTINNPAWRIEFKAPNNQHPLDIRNIANQTLISTLSFEPGSSINKIIPTVRFYSNHSGSYKEIHRIQAPESNPNKVVTDIHSLGDQVYVAFPTKLLYKFDINTLTHHKVSLPKSYNGIATNPDTGFLTIWLAMGAFSNAYTSQDLGTSWKKLPKPPYQPRHIQMNSMNDAQMWSIAIGMNSTAFELKNLNVDKHSWESITKSDIDCRGILKNYTQQEHYCLLPYGGLRTYSKGEWLDDKQQTP